MSRSCITMKLTFARSRIFLASLLVCLLIIPPGATQQNGQGGGGPGQPFPPSPTANGGGLLPPRNPGRIKCGTSVALSEKHEFFTSPNFPKIYEKNSDCTLEIREPLQGTRNVTILIGELDIEEEADSCPYDYLLIQDGNGDEQARLCGEILDRSLYFEAPLTLTFVSDDHDERRGFILQFYQSGTSDEGRPCEFNLDSDYGFVKSPGFPVSYPPDISCTWTIALSEGERIEMYFERIDIENDPYCRLDSLSIDTGNETISVCGQYESKTYTSFANRMVLTFTSDSQGSGAGFKGDYQLLSNSEVTAPECGAIMDIGDVGTIKSPGYPEPYPANLACSWTITAEAEHVIEITFRIFELRQSEKCRQDRLQITDGSHIVGSFCGRNKPGGPDGFLSKTNNVIINFTTSSTVNWERPGFVLEFEFLDGQGDNDGNTGAKGPGPNPKGEKGGGFRCQNDIVIPRTLLCNGEDECGDGSDESSTFAKCTGTYTCKNGESIPDYMICNRIEECSDGSDEGPSAGCIDYFLCEDGSDIPRYWLCDGKLDCSDGSDEGLAGGCSVDVCSTISCYNGGTCIVSNGGGAVCDCSAGWSGTSCEHDIDDSCLGKKCKNGGTCFDGVNKFTCACALGFTGPTCTIASGISASFEIYVTDAYGTDNTTCGDMEIPCQSLDFALSRLPSGGSINILSNGSDIYELKDVWLTKTLTISGTTNKHLHFENVIITGGFLTINSLNISGDIYLGNSRMDVSYANINDMRIQQEYQSRTYIDTFTVTIDDSVINGSQIITRSDDVNSIMYKDCQYAALSIGGSNMHNTLVKMVAVEVEVRLRTMNITSDLVKNGAPPSGVFIQGGAHSDAGGTSSTSNMPTSAQSPSRKRRSAGKDNWPGFEIVSNQTTSVWPDGSTNSQNYYTEVPCDGRSWGNCLKPLPAFPVPRHHRVKRQTVIGDTVATASTDSTSILSITGVNFLGIRRPAYDDFYLSALGMFFLPGSSFMATVEDCTFEGNDRAINVILLGSSGGSLFVRSSTFEGNSGKGPGGAINIEQLSGVVTTRVIDTVFTNNVAEKLTPEQADIDVTKVSKLSGNGGAIAITIVAIDTKKVHNNIDIEDCSFKNNTSENYGGTLYFTGGVGATLFRCNISNVDQGNLRPRLGDAIESRGNLFFKNTTLTIHSADDNVAVLSYRADKDGSFMESTDLAFYCPKGYQTTKVFNAIESPNATRNPIETLLLYCKSCKRGSYTLENSGALVNGIKIIFTTINTCNECPYGATCDASVQSKTNFWGERERLGRVTMHTCPSGYCCQKATCLSYQACAENRVGPLCGACATGYSEAMFSTTCIPNENCSYFSYVWIVIGIYGLGYVLFFVFEDELKLIVADFSDWLKKRLAACRRKPTDEERRNQNSLPSETGNNEEEDDASDAFLNIFMYYVQVSELLKVDILYEQDRSNPLSDFQDQISDVFSFDTLGVSSDVCLFPDVNAVLKRLFKTGFIIYMFVTWGLLFIVGGLIHCCIAGPKGSVKWIIKTSFRAKFLGALVNLMLYTYQYFAENTFSVLRCVDVGMSSEQVLYIDGNVTCYQTWQYGVFAFAAIYVFPFFIVLTFAPALLKQRQIHARSFIISIVFPLFGSPYLVYAWYRWKKIIKKNNNNSNGRTGKEDGTVDVLTGILTDPYRTDFCGGLCWEGMSSLKRLLLVLISTLVTNVLYKHIAIMLICYASLALQIACKAFATPLSNTIESISLGILLLISIMNLLKAVYFNSGEVPVGTADNVFYVYDWTESILLSAIPMVILGIMGLALFVRICDFLIQKCCCSRKEKENPFAGFDDAGPSRTSYRRKGRPNLADVQREWHHSRQTPSSHGGEINTWYEYDSRRMPDQVDDRHGYEDNWNSMQRLSPANDDRDRRDQRHMDFDADREDYREDRGGYQTRLPRRYSDDRSYNSSDWPVREGRHIHTRPPTLPDYQDRGGYFDPFHRGREDDSGDRYYSHRDDRRKERQRRTPDY